MKIRKSTGLFSEYLKTWKFIISFIQGSKIIFILFMLYVGCGGMFSRLNSGYLLKKITIAVTENKPALIIGALLVYLVVEILLGANGSLFIHTFTGNTKAKADFALRTKIFRHLVHTPISTEPETHSGDALARLIDDGQWVANSLTWDTMRIVSPFVNLLTSGIITLVTSWQLGIVTIVIGLLFLLVTKKIAVPVRNNTTGIRQAQTKLTQSMMDFLTANQSVKIMGFDRKIINQYEESSNSVNQLSLKNVSLNAWQSTLGNLTGSITSVFIFIFGLILVKNNQLLLPDLLFVYGFSISMVYSLIGVGRAITSFQNVAVSSKRILDVLNRPFEDSRDELPNITSANSPQEPAVELKNIEFTYREELQFALNGISFSVQKGEHIALVGESGCGKSTVFRILLGLYLPQSGDLRIYGEKVSNVNLKSQRDQFAYVSQESPLFDGTIRENILFGNQNASEEEIIDAAKIANAHDFISAFPNGYDEQVGELGARLSGGQRQRIAIARAVLRNSPILLLDEATSSLDSQNEDLVQEALDRFSAGRTTIVAAHRLSTIRNVDRIFVFSKGVIVESGTHDELFAKGGYYAQLVNAQ